MLEKSAAICKKTQSTITKASKVTKREGLIGSTLEIEARLARVQNIMSQIESTIGFDEEE